jgi:SAM-dependent methyltransferase
VVWNKRGLTGNLVRVDEPGDLALFAAQTLRHDSRYHGNIDILDLGCGYGQDSFYLAGQLDCHILGVDNSEVAVKSARESCPKHLINRIEFLFYDFSALNDKFDMIFISNLYYLLAQDERKKLRETARRCLKNMGWLFLNTLSSSDPQDSSRETALVSSPGDVPAKNSYHFSTRKELEEDFGFLSIGALFEREFFENQGSLDNQRHVFWLLLGNLK